MNIQLFKSVARIEGAKRQHAPYVITWTCPECGAVQSRDYTSESYFMNPEIPGVNKIYLTCRKCDHENGPIAVKLDLVLTLLTPEQNNGDNPPEDVAGTVPSNR